MIRLLIVDDQPAIRKGLRLRLSIEPDMQVVGEAADGQVALRLAQTLQPDVVILDVDMPTMDGIDTANALRKMVPHAIIVMLSIYDDARTRTRAAEAGAQAFVPKRVPTDMLLGTLREVTTHPRRVNREEPAMLH